MPIYVRDRIEPLKGKQHSKIMGEPPQQCYFHMDKDIKSAVEWLKKEIQEYKDLGINCHQDCIDEIKKIIDEAFEDVMIKLKQRK